MGIRTHTKLDELNDRQRAQTSRVLFDANRQGTRKCGDCQLCCRLLPMPRGLKEPKPANAKCVFQKFHKGCVVHHQFDKGFPEDCYLWSCRWLLEEAGTEKLSRPDRSHYVLEPMPDYVTIIENETGKQTRIEVIQIWCDPDFPDAHRDPALRSYLADLGKQGVAALVRYTETRALHIIPPAMTHDGEWYEWLGDTIREPSHTPAQVDRALGAHTVLHFKSEEAR